MAAVATLWWEVWPGNGRSKLEQPVTCRIQRREASEAREGLGRPGEARSGAPSSTQRAEVLRRAWSSFASKRAQMASTSSSRISAQSRVFSEASRSHASWCDSAQPTAERVRCGEKEPVVLQMVGICSFSAHLPSRIASGCTSPSSRRRAQDSFRPSTAVRRSHGTDHGSRPILARRSGRRSRLIVSARNRARAGAGTRGCAVAGAESGEDGAASLGCWDRADVLPPDGTT